MAPQHHPSAVGLKLKEEEDQEEEEVVVVQELGTSEKESGSRKRRKSIVNGHTSPKLNKDVPSVVTSTGVTGSPSTRTGAANGIGTRGSLVVGK